jgi:SAM-dependent methyltransferase
MEVRAVSIHCLNADCAMVFPIVDGIPVLINEITSVFRIEDFTDHRSTTLPPPSKLKKFAKKFMPGIHRNVNGQANYAKFANLVSRKDGRPRVLVIGGSDDGEGMEAILDKPGIDLIASDVSFGRRTQVVCDGHDIPFANETFDGVIVQAVLEHVADPNRCVEEIHRVLKPDGLVYAETPFMQQVHGGRYDFTRFTHLGHRRLFRKFEELQSGAVCGPGMALAWSYRYFLLSFAKSKLTRSAIILFSSLTAFWLKLFDNALIDNPGTIDAASGLFFIGKKWDRTISDREIIQLYRGAE